MSALCNGQLCVGAVIIGAGAITTAAQSEAASFVDMHWSVHYMYQCIYTLDYTEECCMYVDIA